MRRVIVCPIHYEDFYERLYPCDTTCKAVRVEFQRLIASLSQYWADRSHGIRATLRVPRWERNAYLLVTHCPRGHEYNESNTYRRDGRRYCRMCNRDRMRRSRAMGSTA